MFAILSISAYFVLNLLVTFTNRSIISQTSSPYFLTAGHAVASYFSTLILMRYQIIQFNSPRHVRHTSLKLLAFSMLFTINITLSNYTLNLVSLPVHQTIRATAPALTVVINIYLELCTRSSYSTSTYLSLLPIVSGVILAAAGGRYDASVFGLLLTFTGAVTAVLKTIATNLLQTHLDMRSSELIRHTAPLAVIQSLAMAYYFDELISVMHLPRLRGLARGEAWSWMSVNSLVMLMVVNAFLAAALNLSSFDANKKCGPVSMGVAANLKQVVVLIMPYMTQQGGAKHRRQVLIGGMITVMGGLWYAVAQGRQRSKLIRLAQHDVEAG